MLGFRRESDLHQNEWNGIIRDIGCGCAPDGGRNAWGLPIDVPQGRFCAEQVVIIRHSRYNDGMVHKIYFIHIKERLQSECKFRNSK